MRARSASQIWQAALGELQLQVNRNNFETWLAESEGVGFEEGTFVVGVPTGFTAEWLQKRLRPIVQKTLSGILGTEIEVKFIVHYHLPEGTLSSQDSPEATPAASSSAVAAGSGMAAGDSTRKDGSGRSRRERFVARLNPKYSFESFIVGGSNHLPYAAALSVAEKPGQAHGHNPLFIYGSTGLGKTHLLHAIGWVAQHRGDDILYVSAEQFTNEFISALREGHTEEFRLRYSIPALLLVDDIQFLAGKEQTQERFFHTFNDLYNASRQIVLSSDRPPAALRPLEERLRSRFEGGLLVDIQPPDLETRMAILQAEAAEQQISLPREIIETIARRVTTNIRDLKGALNRLIAYKRLVGAPLTLSLATQVLAEASANPRTANLSARRVIEEAAAAFRLTPEDITGKRRSKEIALARHVAMYLLREEAQLSLSQIGRELGGRDHSTVLYGYTKVAAGLDQDRRLQRQVVEIREQLYHPGAA